MTSLTVEKIWGTPDDFDKEAVIAEVWRTTDTIKKGTEVPDISTGSEAERVKNDGLYIEPAEGESDQLTVELNGEPWEQTITKLPKYNEEVNSIHILPWSGLLEAY